MLKGRGRDRREGVGYSSRALWVPLSFALFLLFAVILQARAEEAAEPRTGPTRYTLQEGDRLYHLSKRFDVSVNAILEANNVTDARELRAGQELVIPPPGTEASKAQKLRPKTYQVQKGDTLTNISRRYGVSIDIILEANGLSGPREIQAGQELVIPAPGAKVEAARPERSVKRGAKTSATPARPEPAWMRRARKLAEELGLGTRKVAHRILRGDLDPRWVREAGRGRMPAILRFPVTNGWTGRGWGSGPGGYHLAVDVPGEIGARVSAAAPGIVAYANDELPGFGKVVMIIHTGGLVSLYAHNSEFKTVPGERVKRGTRVALLGSSGISLGPHVHFELIYKGQLCDPLPLLRPVARSKSGRPAIKRSELKTWPRSGGPPKGLNCAPRRRHPEYVGKPHGWRPADWGTRERSKRYEANGEDETPHPDPELDSE